ncbi:MAG: helix-turn-helix transcriptional regulator [Pseudomonadota bacterium]
MSFSETIVKLRKQKNWTQQELADKLQMHVGQIKRYEKGSSTPSLEALKKIALLFGISVDEIVFDNGDGVPSRRLDGELLEKFEQINRLSEKEKEAIRIVLDSVIANSKMKELIRSQA